MPLMFAAPTASKEVRWAECSCQLETLIPLLAMLAVGLSKH